LGSPLIVVLPIHNAAWTLRQEVEELLEQISEVTRDFELLIVDVGSTDDLELPVELARQYPQVRTMRKEPSQSLSALVAEIKAKTGAEVLVHAGLSEAGDLDRMWRPVIHNKVLPPLAKGPKGLSGGLLAQLAAWGERLKGRARSRAAGRPASFVEHLRQLASA
jgi:glycosyltransferase involved in cell wall biosynthesis